MEEMTIRIPVCDRPDQWVRGYIDSLSLRNYINSVSFQGGTDGNGLQGSWMVITYFKKLEN